ncbi:MULTISPECIES: hypothetical protein [Vibrionaceae]|uniref:Uncharacterized protein n=1 Tax=Vibrio splendidus TaxID=29497 RepID=A0A2N7FLP9_VIBSP|nr:MULTISPECIES: hypothetical protein [Vibrionaceae]MDH6025260.1 hypothetical protein [Vibrio splendidus]OEE78917.1 hypothetical protein A1OQ_21590 [Enterovibrio norvegicus FF-162]PMJ70223.1 hypothetical protein BCU17_10790 [Vibrio splendidus]
MELFGVDSKIVVNKDKKKFDKIKPIFEEWLKLNRDYIELTESGDNLYWYNERSNISALAGAVWRRGGFAQEEFSSEKGEKSERKMGRVDLYFHFQGLDVICEAKHLFLYMPENNRKCLKTKIKASLANAFEDVKTTTAATDYQDFGLALSFIVPYYLNEKNVEDTEIELDNVLSDLDCSFYVSFKTTTEDIINENDGVYNSVILVGKFA